ncbi:MAG: DUF4870 domain-containing protein [Sulfolobales archaeon]
MSNPEVSEEERIWGFIAWLIPLVGGVLVLVLKPGYRFAKHWAHLSISFFIAIVLLGVVSAVIGLIPFIGWVISTLLWIAVVIVWIVGIVKSLGKELWKPPVIYDLAKVLGIERI